MKTKLMAVMMMLSITLFIGGFASERQLGTAVTATDSATIFGGCSNWGDFVCKTVGSCSATVPLSFSGDGDWEQDTTTNCGVGNACISVTKTKKKCAI